MEWVNLNIHIHFSQEDFLQSFLTAFGFPDNRNVSSGWKYKFITPGF